jgi:hypothetical protein
MADFKEQLENLHDNKGLGSYITDLRKSYSKGPNLWNVTLFYFTTYDIRNDIPRITSNKARSLISTFLEPLTSHTFPNRTFTALPFYPEMDLLKYVLSVCCKK